MRTSTMRFLSKLMCLVLVASFAMEAPLMAAMDAINVKVGGQSVQVTPGQWLSVKQGTQVTNYNVRYVNGQPVALEMSQYMKLIFGGESAAAAATTVKPTTSGSTAASTVKPTTSAPTTSAPSTSGTAASTASVKPTTSAPVTSGSSAQTSSVSAAQSTTSAGSVANNATVKPVTTTTANSASVAQAQTTAGVTPTTTSADAAVTTAGQTGQAAQAGQAGQAPAKSSSWIKDELSNYGSSIKDSFTNGQKSGNEFGTKTVDGAKTGINKVGDVAKGAGSKIGDLLKSAKDRIAKIFHKTPKADTTTGKTGESGQSGQSGQSEQSGQSGQSGQTEQGQPGQDNGQTGQTGQVGQTGQTGQTGQAGQAGQSGEKKPSFMDKTKASLQKGYVAGKGMANEGIQNVKTSLKSGFSPKNLLMTAGITVGVDLATQIMNGEKPSLAKAVKTVASAEFAGGVVGSVTGAAAGSFFVPFLTAIPVVGGVLSALAPTFGSVVGGSVGAYLAGDLKNGKFSIKDAFKRVDWIGVGGQTIGSVAGSLLGSALGPVGTIIGGMVGGYLGNWAAHKIASLFGKGQAPASLLPISMPLGTNPATNNDSSITIGGSAEIPVSNDAGAAQVTVSNEVTPAAVSADSTTIGSYASEVQLAYARYQELYKLYNEMLAQGRQADAMKVATEMNKAKSDYEALKTKAGN